MMRVKSAKRSDRLLPARGMEDDLKSVLKGAQDDVVKRESKSRILTANVNRKFWYRSTPPGVNTRAHWVSDLFSDPDRAFRVIVTGSAHFAQIWNLSTSQRAGGFDKNISGVTLVSIFTSSGDLSLTIPQET